MHRRYHHWGAAIVLVVSAIATGCHRAHTVKSDELIKLNRVGNWTSGQPRQSNANQRAHQPGWANATTRTRETSNVYFEQPNGELVEVDGTADAEITTTGGRTYRFDHPVSVWVEADTVTLADADSKVTFAFDEIEEAHVIQNPQVPFSEFYIGQGGGGITIIKW